MQKYRNGFTLVEVVTVLVLVGILSVAVIGKFSTTDGYESYNYRARLISALRLTQQRAMQQTDGSICHQIVIETKRYGIPDRTNCSITSFPVSWQPDATGEQVASRYSVSFSVVSNTVPFIIGFDSLGRPTGGCSGGCTISAISDTETAQIKIEREGYIHAI